MNFLNSVVLFQLLSDKIIHMAKNNPFNFLRNENLKWHMSPFSTGPFNCN